MEAGAGLPIFYFNDPACVPIFYEGNPAFQTNIVGGISAAPVEIRDCVKSH